MKICWDNIENSHLTKSGNLFANGHIFEVVESCAYCGEPFLGAVGTNGKYCTRKCRNSVTKNRLKDGTYLDSSGYRQIRVGGKYRREHCLKAEVALGRKLKRGEVVHHINLNKLDNRNENLLICTQSYHTMLHKNMNIQWVKMAGLQ